MNPEAARPRGRLKPWLRAHWETLFSYGIPGVLFVSIAVFLLAGAALDDQPVPLIPPSGYQAYEPSIALEWRPGDHKGAFRLQVAKERDFRAPIIDRETSQTRFKIPRPEPGRYCWRVLASDGAPTSCFTVPKDPGAF